MASSAIAYIAVPAADVEGVLKDGYHTKGRNAVPVGCTSSKEQQGGFDCVWCVFLGNIYGGGGKNRRHKAQRGGRRARGGECMPV